MQYRWLRSFHFSQIRGSSCTFCAEVVNEAASPEQREPTSSSTPCGAETEVKMIEME